MKHRASLDVGFRTLLTAGLASVFYCLAYTSSLYAWAAFIFMLPLCFGLNKITLGESLLRGFLFAFFSTVGLGLWIFKTLSVADGGSSVSGLVGVVFISSYSGVFYAVFLLFLRLCINAIRSPLVLACWSASLWVCIEYLRATIPPGMPWALIGLTQIDIQHIAQIADIIGVYGVSWLLVFVGTLMAAFSFRFFDYSKKDAGYAVVVVLVLSLSVAIYSDVRLKQHATENHANNNGAVGGLTVAIFQGSIPIKGLGQEKNMTPYTKLLFEASKTQAVDLFIWPETILGDVSLHDGDLGNMSSETTPPLLQALLYQTPASIIAGGYRRSTVSGKKYNTAFLFDENTLLASYDKIHLMPLVEYPPPDWAWRTSIDIQNSDSLTPGYATQAMNLKRGSAGVFICFDAMYTTVVRNLVLSGADFLINIAEESWLGSAFASKQYLDIARFRAIENRRYLARSSNKGYSAVITPVGEIASVLDRETVGYSVQKIYAIPEITIYTRYGNFFVVLCFMVVVLTLSYVFLTHRRTTAPIPIHT